MKRERVWSLKERFLTKSGPLATAGDVLFYGTMDRWFRAVDARTGEILWQFQTASGIIGPLLPQLSVSPVVIGLALSDERRVLDRERVVGDQGHRDADGQLVGNGDFGAQALQAYRFAFGGCGMHSVDAPARASPRRLPSAL